MISLERDIAFEHANAMPAPTWRFLNVNDTGIRLPNGLAITPNVQVSMPLFALGSAGELDDALDEAQEEWEASHPEPTPAELAERAEYRAAEADATYGGLARSAYQARAEDLEEARLLSLTFEQGTGREVASYLRHAARDRIVIAADEGKRVDASVVVRAERGSLSVAAIDVVAYQDSQVKLSIVVDGPSQSPGSGQAFAGTTVRVFAGKNAQVAIARTQTLGQGASDIDDMGLFAAENARIEVDQTVLGASRVVAGLAGDLRGDGSRVDTVLRYLGRGDHVLDFNYSLRHHGRETTCNLAANGVLSGKSSKTLRGTIDFVRGCTGAEGSEVETVLLVDDGVQSKTVPVILCGEDDVSGSHGATIGHIGEEQLFYLQSRGLARDEADLMFARAVVERAALNAPDEAARRAIVRFGERMDPGFGEWLEE